MYILYYTYFLNDTKVSIEVLIFSSCNPMDLTYYLGYAHQL